ncbi:serine/threonine-protein kinase [Domibacillus mangrovi]|uniref:non-specific serine/threonine protein kinase n=1 Tax=Domibacillus mangrovi TaxID=1714354 RepID=A0A1Q5P1P8_9BACI|nr:serine/threonine-protein kinase [Domibacillus mangrovi]OKL36136.1 hypothetical protein BLL40_12485 [Domibacillus mangrovi]
MILFRLGDVLADRYQLAKKISQGGMGAVWLAEDKVLNRTVAIKTVNQNMLEINDRAFKVFNDEANIGAGLLGHPNVVTVLDYGIHHVAKMEQAPFMVMEYIDGINALTFINQTKAVIDEETYYYISLLIASKICMAIDYAHKKRIFHRDIKPLNVFISKYGFIKVGDFGLSRFFDEFTRTHTVSQFSSPSYSAPEQWKGESYEEKTDIYQLGCTLYHLFTGQRIFEKPIPALIYAHLNECPIPPKNFCFYMPEELSNVIIEMVSKEGIDRPSLWQLNDILAKELHKNFNISITVDKDDYKKIDIVCEVTDASGDSLKYGSETIITFSDFNEVLSEALQLILNDITTIHITALDEMT